jgi:hypothetical protein
VADANDFAHALRLRAEGFVAQEAADVLRHLVGQNIKVDQAIPRMAQFRFIKILIAGEKGRTPQPMQHGDDLLAIIQSLSSNFMSDLAEVNSPIRKWLALSERDIFVEDVHAACRCFSASRVLRSIFSSNAAVARPIASAIASRLTSPWYSLEIESQSNPCATK